MTGLTHMRDRAMKTVTNTTDTISDSISKIDLDKLLAREVTAGVVLNTEAISDIGCNIASGIILENLIRKDVENKVYYINARTLYRNYVNCLDGNTNSKIKYLKSSITFLQIRKGFVEDTKIFIEAALGLGMDVQIYIPDYNILKKNWFNFKDKDDFTSINYHIQITEDDAIKDLLIPFKALVVKTTHKLKYVKDLLITTHIAFDLLNFRSKADVKLLESHTGAIKHNDTWWSKYHRLGKNSMTVFPFTEVLYPILGDKVYIKPQNVKLRKHIYTIAMDQRWSTRMSNNEVLASIKRRDPVLGGEIEKLYRKLY